MMSLSQAAHALQADLHGNDVMFNAVSTDTRNLRPGDLYVAIQGERFDGHEFIDQAKQAGAVAALVSRQDESELPQICVDDTRQALGKLAAHWVKKWREGNNNLIAGITGSNGKTTTKEMCRSIFSQAVGASHVLATEGNYNNDIGMPLTLLSLRDRHNYGVIEMGANHQGEIAYLTNIARPDIAVITNAGQAHLEGFGSIKNIADAKAEIFEGLMQGGVAIINGDDVFAGKWIKKTSTCKQLVFSYENKQADVFVLTASGAESRVMTPVGELNVSLNVPGKHNMMNALAAISVACSADIHADAITAGLNTFRNIQGRLHVLALSNGSRLIDDSYNANPLSVKAAIDVLAQATGRKILVLGEMAELGEESEKLHGEIGLYARDAGIDILFSTGYATKKAVHSFGKNAAWFATQEALAEVLIERLDGNETILVKGSRSAAMENIATSLLAKYNHVEAN